MGTTANITTPANPINTLASEELTIILKPIFTLLNNLQQPGANIETAISGIPVVELQEAAQLPAIQTLGINNVAAAIQAKLTAWQVSVATSSASGSAA